MDQSNTILNIYSYNSCCKY